MAEARGRRRTGARGVALWLTPEEETRAALASLIADLAARFGTPAFEPHVTLLTGLRLSGTEVVRRASALALEPLTLSLRPAEGRNQTFRCLYLPVVETLRLLHAVALARSAYGIQDEGPYEPHLSLVYGILEQDEKSKLAKEISTSVPTSIRFAALDVVKTQGPVTEWRRLARFPIDRPPVGQPGSDS
jgi:hypothetical protein